MTRKLPMSSFDVQAFLEDIEPEQLPPCGVPQRAFAKLAFGVVVNHVAYPFAASNAATISLARAAMPAVVIPGL